MDKGCIPWSAAFLLLPAIRCYLLRFSRHAGRMMSSCYAINCSRSMYFSDMKKGCVWKEFPGKDAELAFLALGDTDTQLDMTLLWQRSSGTLGKVILQCKKKGLRKSFCSATINLSVELIHSLLPAARQAGPGPISS